MKHLRHLLGAVLAALALAAAAQLNPFTPVATTSLTVTNTAAALSLPTATTDTARQVVLTTIGTQTAFIVCDGTLSTAATTATTSNGMPLLANSQIVITLPGSITRCSAIAGAAGSTVYATAGFGQ